MHRETCVEESIKNQWGSSEDFHGNWKQEKEKLRTMPHAQSKKIWNTESKRNEPLMQYKNFKITKMLGITEVTEGKLDYLMC